MDARLTLYTEGDIKLYFNTICSAERCENSYNANFKIDYADALVGVAINVTPSKVSVWRVVDSDIILDSPDLKNEFFTLDTFRGRGQGSLRLPHFNLTILEEGLTIEILDNGFYIEADCFMSYDNKKSKTHRLILNCIAN